MNASSTVIAGALIVIGAILAMLLVVSAVHKSVRTATARRRDATARELRPLVASFLAEDDTDSGQLEIVSRGEGIALDDLLTSLLTKVRGDDRERLVDTLQARGVVDRARRSTRAPNPVTRANACEFLGVAGDRCALFELLRLLDDPDADVRRAAVRALGRIGSSVAVPHLLAKLDGNRPVDRNTVTMALLRFGPAAIPELRAGLVRSSPVARAVSAELLGRTDGVESLPTLTSRVEWDDDLGVRVASVRALGRIGSPGCLLTVLDCLGDEQPTALRVAAVRAMSDIGCADSVPVLEACMDTDAHELATAAAEALLHAGPEGRNSLTEMARDADRRGSYAREALTFYSVLEAAKAPRSKGAV